MYTQAQGEARHQQQLQRFYLDNDNRYFQFNRLHKKDELDQTTLLTRRIHPCRE